MPITCADFRATTVFCVYRAQRTRLGRRHSLPYLDGEPERRRARVHAVLLPHVVNLRAGKEARGSSCEQTISQHRCRNC